MNNQESKSIEGVIKSLERIYITIEKDGLGLTFTDVDYQCENSYQGRFRFYGYLCEEVIGRKFELKERYNQNDTFPIIQFLRIWNPNGVGCRDYNFIDKRRR